MCGGTAPGLPAGAPLDGGAAIPEEDEAQGALVPAPASIGSRSPSGFRLVSGLESGGAVVEGAGCAEV